MEGKEHWVSLIKARFGKKTLGEIIRGEALAFLRDFEAKGHLEVRDRDRFTAEAIFHFADVDDLPNPFRSFRGK
jgi:hypothetical protein